jgi:asparagine synthase (glutamine-hydrolysing)
LTPNSVQKILEGYKLNKNGKNEMPLLSKVSVAEISTYMQNVLLRDTDQMSMASSLEVRVPFLDHQLLEYVLAVPDKFKYPSTPKKLLIDATKGLLPTEVINRPKMGFTLPWEKWLKNDLNSFCTRQLHALGKRKEFDDSVIKQLWQSFLQGDGRVAWSRIWILVVLQHWLDENDIEH